MTTQAPFTLKGRNPDVLTCIANLSNDEVFTPPEVANRMLDQVASAWAAANNGANIWEDPSVKFLDPCVKSGVFLREITQRLSEGLRTKIPDLRERVDHIVSTQVYGLGLTRLTALLGRRSVYCSKNALSEHSVAKSLPNEQGHIWYENLPHSWSGEKCSFCGATRSTFPERPNAENHAYAFIHTENIKEHLARLLGEQMQFDVIIGNPPYQLDDGGFGASATPIYNKFVDQARALEPRYLSMIIPSRWLFGGRGLDNFRKSMLNDKRVRRLVDYPDSRQVFPSVDVAGGVCYFLWERDNPGDCKIVEYSHLAEPTEVTRPLIEPGADVFIRSNHALGILRKIMQVETGDGSLSLPEEKRFDRQVSSQKPFGLRTYFRGASKKSAKQNVQVVQSGGRGWVSRSEITVAEDLIDKWKVFTSKSSSEHAGQMDKKGQRRVLSLSGVIPPGSVVTETYIILGAYDTEEEARNCFSYITTKFFRFLIATRSSAQDLARSAYQFIPLQDFSEAWTDDKLYKKYGLTDSEIDLIDGLIRPMTADDD